MGTIIIYENYWENITSYNTTLLKILATLLKRYPDPESPRNSLSFLLVELHRLQVFQKFQKNHKKLDKDKSEEKAFYQFMFKWVEHILGQDYKNKGKYRKRFPGYEHIEELHTATYENLFKKGTTYFAEHSDYDSKNELKPYRVQAPHISDIGEYHSSKCIGFDSVYEAKELASKIQDLLKNDKERRIFNYRYIDNLDINDISAIMDYTPANVYIILKNIKRRCAKKGLIPA